MMMMRSFPAIFILVVVSCWCVADANSKIKHIIIVMEENRSFDHMFGYYPGVNGLKGTECNVVNSTDSKSKKICVDKTSPLIAPCDPTHSTPSTTFKIFGGPATKKGDFTNATMSGFVEWEGDHGNAKTNYCDVMSMLTPEHIPIMSSLASEYAVMDHFFAAHPGPTWPNRMFALSGTSAGCTETGVWYKGVVGQFFPQKTIFDQLTEEKLQWRVYFNDTPWELFLHSFAHNPENIVSLEQFYEDAKTGNLPSYAWINPRSGFNMTLNQGSNDQHPDHDVAFGEAYYKDIYEALRASPQWNETLFIVTYDEHGGYYDHVPTPLKGVPPPGDNETSFPDKNFKFDRLGVRIPTLLISPWIPKGLVVSSPPKEQKPATTSEYTLTSTLATARKLLGLKSAPLSDREAWSATFENVLSLSEPRTDCPMHLPPVPSSASNYSPKQEMAMPINDLQRDIMTTHAHLAGVEFPDYIQYQGQVSEWLQKHFNIHKERTHLWKTSKTAASYELVLRAGSKNGWLISRGKNVTFVTVSTKAPIEGYCLDYGAKPVAGTKVSVSLCYPSAKPDTNRDPAQQWVWTNDTTVRPAAHQNLCLKGSVLEGSDNVYLADCATDGSAETHWAFFGGNVDGDYDHSSGGIGMSSWNLGIVKST